MGIVYNTNIVREGLVLHLDAANVKSYPGSGTTWSDLSGNGNDGTLVNGAVFNGDNKGAMVFDGVNDHISFNNEPDLNGVSFSVGCFFKTNDSSMRLIQNANTGSLTGKNGFQISVTSGTFGNTAFCSDIGHAITFSDVSSTPYIDGNWHNIYIVFDTLTGNGKLFLDGELQSSQTNSNLIGRNMNGEGLTIGIANDGTQQFLGSISNAQIYNRALTAAEVNQNYNALRGRFGI